MRALLILVPLPFLLGGCVAAQVASTAVEVATLPVRVVSEGVDAVTTSQAEADRRRGRRIREEDERLGREARRRERADAREARRAREPGED
ncbi:MAG TPA: hypothetical protein VF702_13945 [Allosphingosinicella sp.]|jgi:hypothetical protein